MGEPVTLNELEQEQVLQFARQVIEAVRNDEEEPQARYPDGDAMSDTEVIFRIASVLVDTRKALDRACDAMADRKFLFRSEIDKLRRLDFDE